MSTFYAIALTTLNTLNILIMFEKARRGVLTGIEKFSTAFAIVFLTPLIIYLFTIDDKSKQTYI